MYTVRDCERKNTQVMKIRNHTAHQHIIINLLKSEGITVLASMALAMALTRVIRYAHLNMSHFISVGAERGSLYALYFTLHDVIIGGCTCTLVY